MGTKDNASAPEAGSTFVSIMVDDLAHPLTQLTSAEHASSLPLHAITIAGPGLQVIEDILAAAGLQGQPDTYVLRFAPEVAEKLRGGAAQLMQAQGGGIRATAVDARNRVIGQGTLESARGTYSAAAAAQLWQALAVVTAQHYLHDMQRELRVISHTLSELKSWMLLKEQSALSSHETYLQRIARMVQEGALHELDLTVTANQIEHMGRECDQALAMMRGIMQRQHGHLERARIKSVFTEEVKHNVADVKRYESDFDNAAQTYATAIRVKMLLALLPVLLCLPTGLCRMRLEEALAASEAGRKDVVAFYDLLEQRAQKVKAKTDVFGNLKRRRRALREGAADRRAVLCAEFVQLDARIQKAQHHVAAVRAQKQLPPALVVRRSADGKLRTYGVKPAAERPAKKPA